MPTPVGKDRQGTAWTTPEMKISLGSRTPAQPDLRTGVRCLHYFQTSPSKIYSPLGSSDVNPNQLPSSASATCCRGTGFEERTAKDGKKPWGEVGQLEGYVTFRTLYFARTSPDDPRRLCFQNTRNSFLMPYPHPKQASVCYPLI